MRLSPRKVRRAYAKTLDPAHERYDSQERAHRTAFAAVRRVAERAGDHRELKYEPGPSPARSSRPAPAAAYLERWRRCSRRSARAPSSAEPTIT